jgi:hypothetical protein
MRPKPTPTYGHPSDEKENELPDTLAGVLAHCQSKAMATEPAAKATHKVRTKRGASGAAGLKMKPVGGKRKQKDADSEGEDESA